MEIWRGTLQGDQLSLLLFDLMVEPLIRWLAASDKGYNVASCDLKLARKWYVDDGTLVTNSVEDMISFLDIVKHFSTWSSIHLNVAKCKISPRASTNSNLSPKGETVTTHSAHVLLTSHSQAAPSAPLQRTSPSRAAT